MEKNKFQNPSGMQDILSKDGFYYQKIYNTGQKILDFYGFEKIDTPILEMADLFSRGIGEAAEVVEKQMYTLRAKGKDFLALRPEGTVPIMRAYLQHGMNNWPQPVKLWYFGPFFRYERPQAGRYRQFSQFGVEFLGERSPIADAQIILILTAILEDLGFKNLVVKINSIGDSACRPAYKKALLSFLKNKKSELCSDCQEKIKTNPLRIFDCKNAKCRQILAEAPQIINHLCPECHQHFKEVLEILDEIKVSYTLDPYLVRGFDYYTNTVFEVELAPAKKEVEEKKEEKEENTAEGAVPTEVPKVEEKEELQLGSLAGGGRYDKLAKSLGGADVPACGWGIGVERVAEAMKARKVKPNEPVAQVFLAQIGILAKRKTLRLLEDFRKERIRVAESIGRDSLKNQLDRADRLGAKYALILGQKEALDGEIIIRNMENGQQTTVDQKDIIKEVKKRLQ
ncbi:MAG: histidine--tRNA ligase [Candidatus Paceibacterota bacterium]|jgi:histidyl-tRNA synthetase